VRAHVTGDESVPVGRGARGAQRSKRATGTADILDYKLLTEMARENFCHDPAGNVGWSTSRERHDYRHRSRRVLLGVSVTHSGEHEKRRSNPFPCHRRLRDIAGSRESNHSHLTR
jgi:hypothetical protein